MDIYLVRHGQTDGNVARRHQHANTPLNNVGISQAREVAKLLQEYKPTHLVTSRQKRALTTAEIISETIDLVPATSDDLVEILRPDYLVGQRRGGWRMVMYMSLWYLGYRPASYHDGESYEELRGRVERAKTYLASLPSDARVVVVSHAGFITFFLAHLNYNRPLSVLRVLRALCRILLMRNTQITHLTYDDQEWYIRRD